MKLAEANKTCQISSNINTPQAFRIEASAKMFNILSDKLYTKKELAIVREMFCNAWDAHVMAGTTAVPVEMHFPTELEPFFQIKDYGTGLSEFDVHRLYTTYGASNKTDTNDQIGGFGLGCKSPFAYTSQFSIESRYDGRKYTYQAFIQQNGAPACALISNEPTSEHNGMTIRVPARNPTEWKTAHDTLSPFWPTTPTTNLEPVHNSYIVDIPVTDHPYITRIACGLHTGGRYGNNAVTMVQGLTPYWPIVSAPPIHDKDAHDLHCSSVVKYVWLKVGSASVTASREDFENTQSNTQALTKIYHEALAILVPVLKQQAQNADTWVKFWQLTSAFGLELDQPSNPIYQAAIKKFSRYTNTATNHIRYDLFKLSAIDGAGTISYPTKARRSDKISYHKTTEQFHPYHEGPSPFIAHLVPDKQKPDVDYIKNLSEQEHHLVLKGDINRMRTSLLEAGFPHDRIIDAPIQPKASRAGKPKGLPASATLYATLIDGTRQPYTVPKNAESLLEMLRDDPRTVLIISHGSSNADKLERWKRLVPLMSPAIQKYKMIVTTIPTNHSRILNTLVKAYPGRVIVGNKLGEQLNPRRLKYSALATELGTGTRTTAPYNALLRAIADNPNTYYKMPAIRHLWLTTYKVRRLSAKAHRYHIHFPNNLQILDYMPDAAETAAAIHNRRIKNASTALEKTRRICPKLHAVLATAAPKDSEYAQLAIEYLIKEKINR